MGRTVFHLAGLLVCSLALMPTAAQAADYDNDGFADLAVGVPDEDVGSLSDPGVVQVIYGSDGGLTATGSQYWQQNSPGIDDAAESNDGFGFALASGDFDGDSFDDLAIGVPNEALEEEVQVGAVHVLYGSAGGLTATGSQLLSQDTPGVANSAERGDGFGFSLAAANLGHGAQADLAVGAINEDLGAIQDAGVVHVLFGSSDGPTGTDSQLWHQDSAGIADTAEADDLFGTSLAAANLGNGAPGDLAIGVPNEHLGSIENTGVVQVIYGAAGGPTAAGSQHWHQNSAGIADRAESFDGFGSSVAAANLGNDGNADLAIGAPHEDLGALSNAGVAQVIYGSDGGLTATGSQHWHQNSAGIADAAEANDTFGTSLAAANLGNSGVADLGIGAPGETLDSLQSAGVVNVVYGSTAGLTAAGSQLWHQDVTGVLETAELGDAFGASLAAANFGNGATADLAIGAFVESVGTELAGAANVIYGASAGLNPTGNQLWHQGSPGIADTPEFADRFSLVLSP